MRKTSGLARTVTLLCLAGGVLGCNGQLNPQAKDLLRSGYDMYGRGDDRETVRRMDAFLQENGRSSRADEGYYLRGLAKYRLGDRPGAEADLNEALGRTERKDIRVGARFALGEMAYEDGDMALAENAYRQALADIEPGQKSAERVYYRLGCILQRQGRWRDASGQFRRLRHHFVDSELAKRAGRRVNGDAWTVQVGAFRAKSRADAVAAELRGKGFQAFSQPVPEDSTLLFVVQVGLYPTYEQAVAALGGVQQTQSDAFVTVTTR